MEIPEPWRSLLPPDRLQALREVLAQDPRPSYQHDPDRIYGFPFAGYEIRFQVKGSCLVVCEAELLPEGGGKGRPPAGKGKTGVKKTA